jgi:AbiU2
VSYDVQIKELQDAATTASLNYDVWWILRGDETRPKYVDVMNQYRLYFHAAIGAHFAALLLALYRLYETRSDTHNIPKFLDRLKMDGALRAEDLGPLYAQLATARPLWVKVSILRNNVYGHRALDQDIEEAFQKAGVTPNDFRDLVALTKDLLNNLTLKLRGSAHAFNLSATRDTLRALDVLKTQLRV